MATFGERLKELRKEKDLTLDELAEKLGTTKATLSRYEHGAREPKLEIVQQLAVFFEVTVDFITGKSNERTNMHDFKKDLDKLKNRPADEKAKYLKTEFVNALIATGRIKSEDELTPLLAMKLLQEMFE